MITDKRKQTGWTAVIDSERSLFQLNLGELWAYRDLVLLFVRRNFLVQYKQTVLGPLWHVLQPLLTTLVFVVIFGRVAKLPTDGLPQFLFYLSGTVMWTYFSSVLNEVSSVFLANQHILGRIYFPRLVLPVSIVLSRLISFAVQLSIFIGFFFYFLYSGAGLNPSMWILLTPYLVLLMAGLAFGAGLIVAALTTRYRDLIVVINFGVQLMMFATPVIYPLSMLSPTMQDWAVLNPMAIVIEGLRYAWLGEGVFSVQLLLASSLTTLVVILLGVVLFRKNEINAQDTI